ncbi:MAG: hypothetical protein QNJ20_16945, partial [Paracoccaceae bacterium]|nr:hypothetical protein [Paracoccaceae bacterium]
FTVAFVCRSRLNRVELDDNAAPITPEVGTYVAFFHHLCGSGVEQAEIAKRAAKMMEKRNICAYLRCYWCSIIVKFDTVQTRSANKRYCELRPVTRFLMFCVDHAHEGDIYSG